MKHTTPKRIIQSLFYLFLTAGCAALLHGQAVPAVSGTAPAPAANEDIITLPTAPANAAAAAEDSADVVILPEFSVSGRNDGSYLATESTSGTRIATKIIDLPYTVQVLTQDFINDFQLLEINEQASFISGMAPGDPASGTGAGARLRGFSATVFRNGFYRTQAPEANSIERVETIKGPQSAIYGRTSPGGVVNQISKKPRTKFQTGAAAVIGSYDYERYDAYVTGPLIRGKLYYRVDLSYYDFERNTDFYFNRTTNLFGVVTYKVNQNTSLTFEYEHTDKMMNAYPSTVRYIDRQGYLNAADPADRAHWRVAGSVYDLMNREEAEKIQKFNAVGSEHRINRKNDSYYAQLEHRFAPDFSMRANLGYSKRSFWRHWTSSRELWDPDYHVWGRQAGYITTNPSQIPENDTRGVYHRTIDYDEYGMQIDFTKIWRSAKGIRQRTLLTFDYYNNQQSEAQYELSKTNGLDNVLLANGLTQEDLSGWYTINPYNLNPKYSVMPKFTGVGVDGWDYFRAGTADDKDSWYRNTVKSDTLFYGALLNHTMDFFDGKLNVIASLRQDYSEIKVKYPKQENIYLQNATGNFNALTYSGGVTYNIYNKAAVAYVSYGKSYNPSPTVDPNVGTIYGDLTAEGVDFGIKGMLFNEGFSYAISGYKIKQSNEPQRNPLSEGNPEDKSIPYYDGSGSTSGDGFSIDVSGRIAPGLSVLGQMSWVSAEYSSYPGRPDLIGQRPPQIPAKTFGTGITYRPPYIKGFRIGVSCKYVPAILVRNGVERTASAMAYDPYYVPSNIEWSGFIGYVLRVKKKHVFDLSLNVINAADNKTITRDSFAPNGREIRFTLRYTY